MIKVVALMLGLLCFFHQAAAIEYDMFLEVDSKGDADPALNCSVQPRANILFLLDTSTSMRGDKIQDLQQTLLDLLANLKTVNVALMTFNHKGGAVVFPFTMNPASNNNAAYRFAVQDFTLTHGTPITSVLYEAYRYYAGESVLSGNSTDGVVGAKVSVPSSYDNKGYISPIRSAADKFNHIILMTDGAPTYDVPLQYLDTRPYIEKLTGKPGDWNEAALSLVGFMAEKKSIKVHTISFSLNEEPHSLLREIAKEGSGGLYEADNADELLDTFVKIVDKTTIIPNAVQYKDKIASSVASGLNEFNPLTTRNELFFTMVKPAAGPRWQGNLREYVLKGDPSRITDSQGRDALDAKTGLFVDTSRSFWSPKTDGMNVAKGGAVSQLPDADSRRLLTEGSNRRLNPLDVSNVAITNNLLGVRDEVERQQVLQWIRGVDVNDENQNGNHTESRQQMGDSIYSVPLSVTYGGTDNNPDMTIFFGTNEGFLHAIDAKSGKEQFAFMPQSLLKNIPILMKNAIADTRPFGMDASPVMWRKDNNADVQIRAADGDFVYVYSGMRRGGRDYYALDVTNRQAPELLWKISGGVGDFASLGQTWSTPVKTQVRLGDQRKDVLLFAGGYDPLVDEQPKVRVKANMGNAIYMVDAETGQLIWMAGKEVARGKGIKLAAMEYAIPANLEVVDMDRDGVADQFYVGDLGGQIWRFDISNGNDRVDSLVQGGVVARLADDTAANNRRFFAKPDTLQVAIDGKVSMRLVIGSGSLTEPLSTEVKDRFYVLDLPIRTANMDYSSLVPLTETDLEDRTNRFDGGNNISKGWYIQLLEKGEKVLASSLTINYQTMFTTFIPNDRVSVPGCSGGHVSLGAPGVGRSYLVDVINGNPIHSGGGAPNRRARYHDLRAGTMPGQPRILFENVGNKIIVPRVLGAGGLLEFETNLNTQLQDSYWFKQPAP